MIDNHNNYIDDHVFVGNNLKIGYNNSLGTVGFGFEKDKDGEDFVYPLKRNPHKFGVIIGDNVEVDSNCVIERGSWRDTMICEGTKIDSFTHIGHNTQIRRDCIIVGAKIGGSVDIGNKVKIWFGAIIKDHVKIGDNAVVGMGSVVLHDVPDNTTVVGNPAHELIDQVESLKIIRDRYKSGSG